MGEAIYCYALSTWEVLKDQEFNNGLDNAIDYLKSLQREDLNEIIDALIEQKRAIDTAHLSRISQAK